MKKQGMFLSTSLRPAIRLGRSLLTASLLLATTATAQTLYVQPSAEIPMRRGQGTDYKIIAIVSDGTAVTLLKEKAGWAQVRLKNDKQGWILKRYLSPSPPLSQQLGRLTSENQELTTTLAELRQQLEELSTTQGSTAQELSACIAERTDIQERYQTLERDTMDVVQTKEALSQARLKIEKLKQDYSGVKIANSVLKKNESIKWFLAGTGVLLLGWLLGRFSKGSRNKKSSLLS
ncbi:TIGR04211 family SH3 domain-containing protein [Desulfogranum mediterraneum]|uniref:TIGR04211 family SH3 domain-containing protein n=1 Tax=Desulfogranum mediterraneum TaxID=160661 RepID=UPI000A0783DB|nr:TIGR04211 family SH3 domain-containing protein [Desulfogranum mediterraneum]